MAWILWNSSNYGTVNIKWGSRGIQIPIGIGLTIDWGSGETLTDFKDLVIEGCGCPKKWRIEGAIDSLAISFKNHNFGWDYEKAMLCSHMWDVTVDGTPIKNYYHGSPHCDDHMKSYCQRTIDSRLKIACTCIDQARELQAMFQDSPTTLALHCLINSCNDARTNVYKTAEQITLRCSQQICEQNIDLTGSSIILNGTSTVICNSETSTHLKIVELKPNQQIDKIISTTSNSPIPTSTPKISLVAISSFVMLGISVIVLLVYWYKRRTNLVNLEKLHLTTREFSTAKQFPTTRTRKPAAKFKNNNKRVSNSKERIKQ
jgi:hypothetical protein